MKVSKFEKKRVPYTKVIQRLNEPYQDFLERLQKAVEMADIPEEVKPVLAKELARTQANDQTRQILSQLPAKASIADMIKRVLEAEAQTAAAPVVAAVTAAFHNGTNNNRCGLTSGPFPKKNYSSYSY